MARKPGSTTKSFSFDGKRYYVTGSNEVDAEIKKAMRIRDLEEGKVTVSGKMTLNQWAEICIETYKTNQAPNTQKKYRNSLRVCVLDHIGNYPLKKIKPIHCQNVINLQQGNSKYQIGQVYQQLNFMFKKAVENQLILTNPAEYIQKPSGTKTGRRSITEFEREHVLKVSFDNPKYIYCLLMLYCGCRPSEAVECMGRDVKMIGDYNVLHIRGTKSSNADRIVPLHDDLYDLVKDIPPFAYLCPNSFGNKRSETSRRRLWDSFRYDLNLSMGCMVDVKTKELLGVKPLDSGLTAYCLRHTFCTELQKQGVDIRSAQYLMGHSDIALTANIYTHADNSTIIDAAKKMIGDNGVVQHLVQHQHPLKATK